MEDGSEMRILHCYGCLRDLPEPAFSIDTHASRGRSAKCRNCRQEEFPTSLLVERVSYEDRQRYGGQPVDMHERALNTIVKLMRCSYCGASGKVIVARKISTNEVNIVRGWCLSCHREGGRNLNHKDLKLRGIIIELLPVYQTAEGHVCAVDGCFRTDTELHHWLPRHINSELAEMYPQSYLCRSEHHPLWHRMVTPDMSMGGNEVSLL